MYSPLQQQCLTTLGIKPLKLKDKKTEVSAVEAEVKTSGVRPSLKSLLNPSEGNAAEKAETVEPKASMISQPEVASSSANASQESQDSQETGKTQEVQAYTDNTVVYLDWSPYQASFITDLNASFPQLSVDGNELKLTEQLSWKIIDSNQPPTTNAGVLVTSRPERLTAKDKAHIWRLVQGQ